MGFADRLRQLRNDAGLTQEQLAHACGFAGQSRIANYEAAPERENAREPTLDELPTIAAALKVPTGALVDDVAFAAHRNGLAGLSQLSRQDIENIVDAVRLATNDALTISAERFMNAYQVIVERRTSTAAASRKPAQIADRVAKKNVDLEGRTEGTRSPARSPNGRRKA